MLNCNLLKSASRIRRQCGGNDRAWLEEKEGDDDDDDEEEDDDDASRMIPNLGNS